MTGSIPVPFSRNLIRPLHQNMFGHAYRLVRHGGKMTAFLDETELFSCSCGVSVTTDLDGNILYLWGIEEFPVSITLLWQGRCLHGQIAPNQQVTPELDGFCTRKQIAFDYPYQG